MNAADPFLRVVARLVLSSEQPYRILSMSDSMALLEPADVEQQALVVRWPDSGAEASEESLANLATIIKEHPKRLDVIVVGGDERALAQLEKARPLVTKRRVSLHQVAADGSYACQKSRSLATLLEGSLQPLDDEAWAAFEQRRAADALDMAPHHEEAHRFDALLTSGSVIATTVLLAIIAVMYAVELMFGAPESSFALLRLGALSPALVAKGDLFRLLSVAALHGSWSHVFFNGMVLWNLGGFLERVIGSARFIVLFVVSVLAGSVASIVLVKPTLSVGASGGLWGILAAQAVLAWGSRGVLPRAVLPQARRAAIINLGLNVLVSFLPHVDWGAHAGGALAGGLTTVLFLRGLPRLDDFEPGESLQRPPSPRSITTAAWILGTVFVAAIVMALAAGRPWQLSSEPVFESVVLSELGATVEMPASLTLQPVDEDNVRVWGDLMSDPALCIVNRFAFPTGVSPARAIEMAESELSVSPESATVVQPALHERIDGESRFVARFAHPNGLSVTRVLVPFDAVGFVVECYVWPGRERWQDVAIRVAASLRPTTTENRE